MGHSSSMKCLLLLLLVALAQGEVYHSTIQGTCQDSFTCGGSSSSCTGSECTSGSGTSTKTSDQACITQIANEIKQMFPNLKEVPSTSRRLLGGGESSNSFTTPAAGPCPTSLMQTTEDHWTSLVDHARSTPAWCKKLPLHALRSAPPCAALAEKLISIKQLIQGHSGYSNGMPKY